MSGEDDDKWCTDEPVQPEVIYVQADVSELEKLEEGK